MDDEDPVPLTMNRSCILMHEVLLQGRNVAPEKPQEKMADEPICRPLQMIGVHKLCHWLKVTKAESDGPLGEWIYIECTTMVQ